MNKLLIICGPTATGKTALAVTLGTMFVAELVSADSRQVYKNLDIISGKDLFTKEFIEKLRIDVQIGDLRYSLAPYQFHGVSIWLYDVVEANGEFSVNQYQTLARRVVADIQKAKKLPIVVGGTGLYIRSLTQCIDTISVPQNISLRKSLNTKSITELQQDLMVRDSTKWMNMNSSDRANPRRLIRAIEVAVWKLAHPIVGDQTPAFDVLWIGLTGPLEVLKNNIERRVRARFAQGVVEEVRSFGKTVDDIAGPAASALGLDIVRKVIAGQLAEDDAVIQWTVQEFAYAKRQLTWFRKIGAIHWFDITQKNYQTDIQTLVRKWYTTKRL